MSHQALSCQSALFEAIVDISVIKAIYFSYSRQVNHLLECIKRKAPQFHDLETTRSCCQKISYKQVSSHMQDPFILSLLCQSKQPKANVFFSQRANLASFSSVSILLIHYDGFE